MTHRIISVTLHLDAVDLTTIILAASKQSIAQEFVGVLTNDKAKLVEMTATAEAIERVYAALKEQLSGVIPLTEISEAMESRVKELAG